MSDLTNEEKIRFSNIMYNSNGRQEQQIQKLTPQQASKLKEYYAQKIAFQTVNSHIQPPPHYADGKEPVQNSRMQTLCCCLYPQTHRDKFDIRTKRFLKRCVGTIPFFRSHFLQIGEGKPQLYGPLWITIAYAIVLSIIANLNHYFLSPRNYLFQSSFVVKSFLIVALFKVPEPLIYSAIVKCLGGTIGKMESAMLTGYSTLYYIIPTLLCFIPSIHWHLIMLVIGGIIRSIFLWRNFSPRISAKSIPLLIGALVIQALYCLVIMKVVFGKINVLYIQQGTKKVFHQTILRNFEA